MKALLVLLSSNLWTQVDQKKKERTNCSKIIDVFGL